MQEITVIHDLDTTVGFVVCTEETASGLGVSTAVAEDASLSLSTHADQPTTNSRHSGSPGSSGLHRHLRPVTVTYTHN